MGTTADSLDRLNLTLQDWNKGAADLAAALRGGPGGVAGAATPVAAVAASRAREEPITGLGGGLGSAFVSAEKSENANGLSVSLSRQFLQSAGAPGAAALVGGLAGGAAGLASAAAGVFGTVVSQEADSLAQMAQAGLDAYGRGGATDSREIRREKSRFALERANLDYLDRSELNTYLESEGFSNGEALAKARISRAETRAGLDERYEARFAPRERANARLESLFGNAARMGYLGTPQGQAQFEYYSQIVQEQENRYQRDLRTRLRAREVTTSATTPGSGVAEKR